MGSEKVSFNLVVVDKLAHMSRSGEKKYLLSLEYESRESEAFDLDVDGGTWERYNLGDKVSFWL